MPDPNIQHDLKALFDDTPQVKGYPYQDILSAASEKYGLSLPYILAVVRGESFFDANAVSHKGAVGLMQVMPATAADYGIREADLVDPKVNIDVGVHYLSDLYTRFQDPYLALAAYYCGPGGVDRENFSLREDCNEYVQYIHSHLKKILAGPEGKIPNTARQKDYMVLTHFDNFLDAENFLGMMSGMLPDLEFDIFRWESERENHSRFQYRIMASGSKSTDHEKICRAVKSATGFSFCNP
ncbi:lytic transglycosylase domain-containing protein [Desulfosarcina ovata]|nr:transglycosylase SLT domain-containing protein [Desulfosarcina ovata]